jgi:hypothetical protein
MTFLSEYMRRKYELDVKLNREREINAGLDQPKSERAKSTTTEYAQGWDDHVAAVKASTPAAATAGETEKQDLLKRLQNHIIGMAPHQKARQQGSLLIEAYGAIAGERENSLMPHTYEQDSKTIHQLREQLATAVEALKEIHLIDIKDNDAHEAADRMGKVADAALAKIKEGK